MTSSISVFIPSSGKKFEKVNEETESRKWAADIIRQCQRMGLGFLNDCLRSQNRHLAEDRAGVMEHLQSINRRMNKQKDGLFM